MNYNIINNYFKGRDLNVFYKDNNSATIIVTFTKYSKNPPAALFATNFLDKNSFSFIAFQATSNHWWHTSEMDKAIEETLPFLKEYNNVITYGASMGASGALLLSKALGANRVIAIAPQYSINPNIVPEEKRWDNEAAKIKKFTINPCELISEEAEKVIVYDPFERLDQIQAQYFSRLRNLSYLKISLSGHSPPGRMLETDVLSEFINILFADDLKIRKAEDLIRYARKRSNTYRVQLLFRKYGKRNAMRAIELIENMNSDIRTFEWEGLLLLARLYKRTGNLRRARGIVEQSIAISPRFKNVFLMINILRKMDKEITFDQTRQIILSLKPNKEKRIKQLLYLVEQRMG